jgi:hypothetical protein
MNAKVENQSSLSLSTVNLSKVDPLYKCRSTSFYRETNGLFPHRDCPCVKRIDTECARPIPGGLHLSLHVISASRHHAANHGAYPASTRALCRKDLELFGDAPFV